ncbi:mucoidy inhibitor MuiA family protein [Roseimarinus sediminis]|uniref:mucoidy inhibitor MuiA family protein n=1 Tax=Roseimarinus sediminis TaxID=1610899 RepID=UPI003D1DD015
MNKRLPLIGLAICLSVFAFGQYEKEISSEIKRVTVFTKGAQIEREARLSLQEGPMILKLTGLSPYINKKSIRIDGDGSYTILTVQHQNDYLNELEKNKELETLKNQIEAIQMKMEEEETRIKIIEDQLNFLHANKEVNGKEQSINPETFRLLNAIYGESVETLYLNLLQRQRNISDHKKELAKLKRQESSINSKSNLPSGTIVLALEAKQAKTTVISFNYLVDNAAWYPSYDMRFLGFDQDLNISYKANIRQNTGIDWKDVSLVLSTAQTDLSASIPALSPFYLQFHYPEMADVLQGRVAGVQLSEKADAPEANSEIRIRGVGAVSGLANPLYIVDGRLQNDISSIDPDHIAKIDVLKDAAATALYGSRGANGVVLISTKSAGDQSSLPLTITSKRETSNEYLLDASQTIPSNNKTTTVSFREAEIEADFVYQAIPKLSENVFLIGRINDWYKAELSDGEVNVYLEHSYVGQSKINTAQFSDTLEVSFGIDNNISIQREKLSEFTANQFIGSNRTETIAYKISLRNNKSYPVSILVYDQIPISTTKEIQVETLDVSDGKADSETGKVAWDLSLSPNENKELIIKYSVKYPKDKRVIVD